MHFEQIKLQNGQVRWVATADGPPDPITGKRKQIQRRDKSKKIAKQKVENEIAKREDELERNHGYAKNITFAEVAADWLAIYEVSGVKRASIYIREKQINVLNKGIGKFPIDKISHKIYQDMLIELAKDHAINTMMGYHSAAGQIFTYAMKIGLIDRNPKLGAVVPKKARTVQDIKQDTVAEKYLNHEELDEFFSVMLLNAQELDIERFYLLAFTGMRPGELCALQKDCLDFENNTVSIHQTLYSENNNMREYELNTPKTNGSIRKIEIEPDIMKMLKRLVKSNDERKMRLRLEIPDFHDKDFLFCRPNGYPYETRTINKRMQHIMSMTSITKKATPHIFRHTHISMLTEAEVDLPTIMKRVGHEDVKTTMRVYTHVTEKMEKKASKKLAQANESLLKKMFS